MTTQAPPLARTLSEIITDALQADCGAGDCWAHHLEPCSCSPGVHVARLYRAERRGLISGTELHAVLDELVVFTAATVVCGETSAEADRLDDLERRHAAAGCDIFGGPLTGAAS